ncbi:MMPL family transporter [Pseudonocardia sp. NPDC049635]|uniref:MMPL family transporter n=1 Tax=Pseudonocardia sp. NPDC049635 TaxID=3155506 RepID=UPI0033DAE10D
MAGLLYRLGRFAARRARAVIAAWIAVLAVAGGAFLAGFTPLASNFDIPGTASGEVIAELEQALPDISGASGLVVFSTTDGSPLSDTQREAISALARDAEGLPDVASVVDPFVTEQQLADRRQELEAGRQQLADGQEQLERGREQIESGLVQLDAAQAQLDAARAQLEAAGLPAAALEVQLGQLDAQQAQLDAQREQIPRERARLDEAQVELDENRRVLEVGTELFELSEGISTVSADGSTALMNIAFTEPRLELTEESKQAVVEHFGSQPVDGVEVSFSTDIAQGVPSLFGVGEAVGLAVAAVVLVVVLGSLLAATFPLVTAILGVGIGVAGALAFSGVVEMNSVTPVLGVMLGLAVGIDYSLFIINRHRRQLVEGMDVGESIGLANGTAGNAVVFAGATVVVALLALNVVGVPFLGVMGTVAAVCVVVAVLLAVTMTPALLGLAGTRLLGRAARERAGSTPQATGAAVAPMPTWRALVTAVVSIAALLVIAVPATSMRVGLPDGSTEPEGSASHTAFTTIEEKFGPGVNGMLLVSAELPAGLDDDGVLDAQLAVARVIAEQDDVVAVAPIAVSDDHRVTAFQVVPAEGPNAESTAQLVTALRALPAVDGDITLGVAGQAAVNMDISQNLLDVLPVYLTVVIGLSLIIMIGVFRSFLVPLVATAGFVLSLFATYGALVAVFQWGWLAGLFGIHATGPLLSFLPVILVGVLFGLAMDYQLFLASGMREAYVHGASPRVAVVQGFRAGRAVVTAAGLIMVSVFAGFVFADSMMIRSIGFGLAFGVLVDAFVVRMLLMPALMHLLGRAAWWIPRWLDRILPDVDVEGAALERRQPAAEAATVRSGSETDVVGAEGRS